jgi:hypothetical protein
MAMIREIKSDWNLSHLSKHLIQMVNKGNWIYSAPKDDQTPVIYLSISRRALQTFEDKITKC